MNAVSLPMFLRRPLLQQIFAFIPALVITERFYHFHSFSLEFAGFLATWFVLDLVVALGRKLLFSKAEASTQVHDK